MPKRPILIFSLLLLSAINLVNYIDRYLIASLLPLIKSELRLSHTQEGLLGTGFVLVYLMAAPIFGWFGDRSSRRPVIAIGISLWSLATAASGLARGFGSLLVCRSLVGIGEAAYASVSPGLIAEYTPPRRRAMAMSFFYMAIPLGAALGYMLGGALGVRWGWRPAFWVVGLPGMILAGLALVIHEPRTGGRKTALPETPFPTLAGRGDRRLSGPSEFLHTCRVHLLGNPGWVRLTAAYTLYTFAMGGMAFWMPRYLSAEKGFSIEDSGFLFGAITVAAGIGGTLCGGWLADRLQARQAGGYVRLSWLSIALSLPFIIAFLPLTGRGQLIPLLFAAEFLLFMNTGPVNTMIIGCVPAHLRSMSMAVNIFFIHLLGDALSPFLIGWIADASSLSLAVWIIPLALAAAALVMSRIDYRPAVST